MTAADTAAPNAPAAGLTERERVLRVLRRHEAEPRALGVAHLSLFRSLARGEAGPGSDVDVVIDIVPAASSRCSTSARSGSRSLSCSAATPTP